MTEITSEMDTEVYDNQPRNLSHDGKDVAGFGSPPQSKATPQSLDDVAANGDIHDTNEPYATNNPFQKKRQKVSSAKDWLLPCDLIEYIFSRTPIESLIQCKLTSKQWYALFKDKRFIYNHLDLSKERLMRVYADKVEIINPETLDILSLPVPAEFNNAGCLTVIHCNGLLLCRWRQYAGLGKRHIKVAVWNPVLGQLKLVESSSHHILDIYGFGYHNDSYMILRVGTGRSPVFEIYDFKFKLWRAFSATLDWRFFPPWQNVCMNGNMYWIAEMRHNRNSEIFIQSFDFSKETFKPIRSFPFEQRLNASRQQYIIDSIAISGFRGDRLSLLRQRAGDETREMEVWVTNKVTDEVVSWSKYFNVARPDLPIFDPCFFRPMHIPTFFIHKTNSIVLLGDKVVGDGYACTSFYEIGEGEIKKQVETGQPFRGKGERNPCICSFVYVPSLVPVPE